MSKNNSIISIPDAGFSEVCRTVSAELIRLPIPGVVVGVSNGEQEWISGFGVTSVENPLPVTPDTFFQIGSITKTFVATLVMRLIEAGLLDLDTPIHTWLPDLTLSDAETAKNVNMRHLLTHTAGWVGDYFNDFGEGDDALAKMIVDLANLEQLTPLGEVWSYNNSGFYLAGRVIEVILGDSFELAISELVLEPLGLNQTCFFAQDVITNRFAVGHEVIEHRAKVARPWSIGRAAHPAGGVICTMGDLLRYARFHMSGLNDRHEQILTQKSIMQMQEPLFPSTGLNQIGLSWEITHPSGKIVIGHGGATNGQICLLKILPEAQFAVAVFTNSDEGRTLCQEITNLALELYGGLTIPPFERLRIDKEDLEGYVGEYEAAASLCKLYLEDGELTLQVIPKGGFPTPESPPGERPPPVRALFYAEDRLIILDEPLKDSRGEFLRGPQHEITWFRFGGRIHAPKR